jgi:hypothetical protein
MKQICRFLDKEDLPSATFQREIRMQQEKVKIRAIRFFAVFALKFF